MKKILLLFLFAVTGTYAQDVVKFSAKIQNRNSDSLVIRGENFNRVLRADTKGNFADSFSVTPGMHTIFDGAEYGYLYLANGFDLAMTIDAKMFDETIAFKGKGEKENNFLAKMGLENEVFGEKLMASKSDPAAMSKIISEHMDAFEAGIKDPGLTEGFRAMMMEDAKAQRAELAAMAQQFAANQKLVGQPSPVFAYENFKGGTTKLEDMRGKYVYIDVWATWCGPCRQEIPYLQEVEKKFHGKKIEFVSISVDQKKDYEKWKKMVGEKSLGGVQLFADKDWGSDFIRAYGIQSIPRFILIGPDGKIVDADAKRPSDPGLTAQLETLVK